MSIVTKYPDTILPADKLIINLIIMIMTFVHSETDESFWMMGFILRIKHRFYL